MNHKTERLLEVLLLITLPVALIAGCAGTSESKMGSIVESYDQSSAINQLDTLTFTDVNEQTGKMIDENNAESIKTDLELIDDSVEIIDYKLVEQPGSANEIEADLGQYTPPEKHIFFFDTDKYELKTSYLEDVKEHADFLLANKNMMLNVNGHADIRGTEGYNQNLSEQRANEITKLLISYGVSELQLIATGHGESTPLNDENALDENRRVEFLYSDLIKLSVIE